MFPTDRIAGCLLGGAIGDARGLAYENLSRRRLEAWRPRLDGYGLLPGLGLVSDDTEHACLTAQALGKCADDPVRFGQVLAWRLRWWLAALPAGIGLATGRAILKLWLGFPPSRSGVRSAGNGPAMRAAIIGVRFAATPERIAGFVVVSTRLTHRDPRAELGALAIALAAAAAARDDFDPARWRHELARRAAPAAGELLARLDDMLASIAQGETTRAFCQRMGWEKGVTGYIVHTVPAALHAWLSKPRDLDAALAAIIGCGGDTDSTAAITGSLVGATVGETGLPVTALKGLRDWPWNQRRIRRLAAALDGHDHAALRQPWFAPQLLRNLGFLALVLWHGLRRLLPPY
ncbi:ADP-ribosylglycohydrolase family protein [Chitinimonas lacunae]|uniref:ADP-ribosylglycohydrolase family protein n=1 Tax=Chitinimonas lacunae TaxID=1963018 RepID=A0ABV8MQY5_9NEIS